MKRPKSISIPPRENSIIPGNALKRSDPQALKHLGVWKLCPVNDDRAFLFTSGFMPELGTYPGPTFHNLSRSVVSATKGLRADAQDVLNLTRMNWNTADIRGKWPVSLSACLGQAELLPILKRHQRAELAVEGRGTHLCERGQFIDQSRLRGWRNAADAAQVISPPMVGMGVMLTTSSMPTLLETFPTSSIPVEPRIASEGPLFLTRPSGVLAASARDELAFDAS